MTRKVQVTPVKKSRFYFWLKTFLHKTNTLPEANEPHNIISDDFNEFYSRLITSNYKNEFLTRAAHFSSA